MIGVGGGLEEIWARPGCVLWSGYGGAMYRIKVHKNSNNNWVKVDKKHKKHKKDEKDKKVKKVKHGKNGESTF